MKISLRWLPQISLFTLNYCSKERFPLILLSIVKALRKLEKKGYCGFLSTVVSPAPWVMVMVSLQDA
ncbi:hypothetical protein DPV79_21505 [Burkholderia reimsis]|uniref:Uncharacterized protein n=1 Tax=Burkholderia reimsis TaxID=2234132 RepID=A0A365QRV4_9BURK|nr:hypothetical protein DPV79_21505 [Burkholderia reimsis]